MKSNKGTENKGFMNWYESYKGKKVVFLGTITYILWLIYDIYCFSFANVFAESLVILSNLTILMTGKTLHKKHKAITNR